MTKNLSIRFNLSGQQFKVQAELEWCSSGNLMTARVNEWVKANYGSHAKLADWEQAEKVSIETFLSPEELSKAKNYVRDGGAVISLKRARKVAEAFGCVCPRIGYEVTLEQTPKHQIHLKHESGKYTVWFWFAA